MQNEIDRHQSELEERASRYAELFPFVDRDAVEVCLALLRSSTVLRRGIGRTVSAFDFNLNGARLQVLRTLYLAPDKRLPLNEIARQMAVSSTNITTIIDVLQRDGWVARVGNEADRRVTYAALTEEGERRCAVFLPSLLDFMSSLSNEFSPEEKRLMISLLAKLRKQAESAESGQVPD